MRITCTLLLALALSGCAPSEAPPNRRDAPAIGTLPAMKSFPVRRATPPQRSNAEIVRDFVDLSFQMESGRQLPIFTRYEGPIRVAMRGPVPATARADLDRLISRLKSEAGIDIAAAQTGNLTIEFVSKNALRRAVPHAACFVVPRAQSFSDYRKGRSGSAADWVALRKREAITIFIPSDVSPQEIRDCLHEEVAQAIGPLNDLYRLPDSVFNDDNFHTVLTGFDMLILRTTYASELRSGMSKAEVAARLPGLLARYNPAGQGRSPHFASENRAWKNAIETALSPRTSAPARQNAAMRALAIAEQSGWHDVRRGFSHFVLGRASLTRKGEVALASYLQAGVYYAQAGTQVQEAHIAMQLAAYALSTGRPQTVLEITNKHIPVALKAENAALLATLLLAKAEALDMLGQTEEARIVRTDSLGWARYGFGADSVVRSRVNEIRSLRPRQGNQ